MDDQIEAVEFSGEEMRTLCASSLFHGYTRMGIASLLTRFDARRKAYSDGAVVADEQEAPTRMGVLLSGSLHVYDSALKGRRHLVRIVRPGEVLGATLSGVSARQAYPALVRAYGPCVLATFSLALVDKFIKPKFQLKTRGRNVVPASRFQGFPDVSDIRKPFRLLGTPPCPCRAVCGEQLEYL